MRGHSSAVKGEEVNNQNPRRYLVTFGLVFLSALLFFRHAYAENVKIGVPSITITSMPLVVAKDAGFFQQEGFTVEVVVMPAAINIKVLLSGDIQYATTVGSAVVASVRGINVRTVMLFVDRPLLDMVGAPGVNSIQEVKGKSVGISSRGGLHDVSMRRILTQSGIDPAQVTILTVGGQGAMFAAAKTGRIRRRTPQSAVQLYCQSRGHEELGLRR
jgi:ABC-type nitrate/sulfonate/bicarbonate transport system substrate-binding protein